MGRCAHSSLFTTDNMASHFPSPPPPHHTLLCLTSYNHHSAHDAVTLIISCTLSLHINHQSQLATLQLRRASHVRKHPHLQLYTPIRFFLLHSIVLVTEPRHAPTDVLYLNTLLQLVACLLQPYPPLVPASICPCIHHVLTQPAYHTIPHLTSVTPSPSHSCVSVLNKLRITLPAPTYYANLHQSTFNQLSLLASSLPLIIASHLFLTSRVTLHQAVYYHPYNTPCITYMSSCKLASRYISNHFFHAVRKLTASVAMYANTAQR